MMDAQTLTARQNAARRMFASAEHAASTTKQIPLVKLCGMSRDPDIATLNRLRPDMCGFIVNFPKSHRSITPERLRELAAHVEPDIVRVGVFVDEDPATIAKLAHDGIIDAAQLHGNENEAYITRLRTLTEIALIQAFRVRKDTDIARAQNSSADMILLDNGQGSGESFDWSLLAIGARARPMRPFILAGGLGPKNVAAAIAATHPFAVDMSSGIETDKCKDPAKMEAAVDAVRYTSQESICPNNSKS